MKTAKLIYLFVTVGLHSSYLFAQQAWNRVVNLPQENTINAMARIPETSTMVAVGEGSTVMYSSDLGTSWDVRCNPAGLDNYADLTGVVFNTPAIGFIVTGQGKILRTLDGGNSWSIVYTGSTLFPLNDIHFFDQNKGLACGDHGLVLKTGNGGDDWFEVNSGVTTHLKEIEFTNNQKGYIRSSSIEYLLTTNDGGNSWTQLVFYPPLELSAIFSIDFPDTNTGFLYGSSDWVYGRIYKTTDGGNTWELNFQANDMHTGNISFSAPQLGILVYSTYMHQSKVFYTTDGGSSWLPATLPGYSMWAGRAVCFYDIGTAFIAGNKGLMFRTDNHGITWTPLYQKIFKGQVIQVQFVSESIGYISFMNELYGVNFWEMHKTTDGGVSWVEVNSIDLFEFPPAFHFPDPGIGYIVLSWGSAFMAKTTDGGGSWVFRNIADGMIPFDVRFLDAETGYISGSDIILKTVNGGMNWSTVYSGSDNYTRILVESPEDIVVIGDYSIVFSNNGGQTWTERGISNATPVNDAFITEEGKIFIAFGEFILWTDNYGLVWNQVVQNNLNPILFNSIFFSSASTGFAVGAGPYETVLKTTDGGNIWEPIDVPATSGLSCIWFFNDLHGYLFGEKGLAMETFTGGIMGFGQPGDHSRNQQVRAFPNPFYETIIIDLGSDWNGEPVSVLIYDMMGRIASQQTFSSHPLKLYLPDLQSGVYFCRLINGKTSYRTLKLIKR